MTPARFLAALSLATVVFFAGYFANRKNNSFTSQASGAQSATYSCPMHPEYRSNRSGDCPVCGMRLNRTEVSAIGTDPNPATGARPGMIQISARKQQLIGVRTEEVRLDSPSHLVRMLGRVAVDDERVYRIIAAADGWIVDLGRNTAGRFVQKNQLLASYYQKDLLAAERLFLLSIPANEQLPKQTNDFSQASIRTAGSANPQFPIDSLRGLGMSDLQIEEIHRTRAASPHVNIYSPASGFVLTRNLSPSQRFEKGTELYRIADISRVWVMVDMFEKDRQFLKPGAEATILYQGRRLRARMIDALPQFDAQSRTLKTRFELDNRDHLLQPDMFVDVEVPTEMPAALTVPADSVIDRGRHKTVFVAAADGVFEPRIVETGWRLGDRLQITSGVRPGERIVVAGSFLIDSESRMNAAGPSASDSAGTSAGATRENDPVCGMPIDTQAPNVMHSEHGDKIYYFCSDNCKRTFQAAAARQVSKLAAPSHDPRETE